MTEWISIEERLPESEENYLFLSVSGCPEINFFSKDKSENIKYYFTHWAPIPKIPKKKRWRPKEQENFHFICTNDCIFSLDWISGIADYEYFRRFLGVYKTEEEAKSMMDKIKKFVTNEIGEV